MQEQIYDRRTPTARDRVNTTVDYFRQHDLRAIGKDCQRYLQSHPTQALIGAVVLGFLAGRVLRRG